MRVGVKVNFHSVDSLRYTGRETINSEYRSGLDTSYFVQRAQISAMSGDLDLSPPEVPEPTFFESVLRYGLFLGAIFQLVCILAIIIPTSKSHEQEESSEPAEPKTSEPSRKPKAPAQQIRQKLKKESKKKR